MKQNRPALKSYLPLVGFFLIGLFFLMIPLLQHADLESAATVSLLGCLYFILRKSVPQRWVESALLYPFLALIPLFINDLIGGCFSAQGLLFWLLIPLPSFLFVRSLRKLLQTYFSRERFLTISIFIVLVLILPLIEFKFSPIIYQFNMIWGYFPGPVYDEIIPLPFALVIHRLFVITWAVLLWELARKPIQMYQTLIYFFVMISLFLNFRHFGIVRGTQDIQRFFDAKIESGNIRLFYHSSKLDSVSARILAQNSAFHWTELEQLTEIRDARTVSIFLYDDPWQKKTITGAKYTQYTPIWLTEHQIHIDLASFSGTIRHELAHLMAKNFAPKAFLHASLNLGLIEGVATALDPDVSNRYTLQEFVAAGGIPTNQEIKNLFSVLGFYRQSSANGYFKSGAFVQFLMKNGQLNAVKKMYSGISPEKALAVPYDTMLNRWFGFLASFPKDTLAERVATARFASPSLFDKRCPRKITDGYALYDLYQKAKIRDDSLVAIKSLSEGTHLSDSLWADWFRYRRAISYLESNEPDSAFLTVSTFETNRSSLIRLDYFGLTHQSEKRDSLYKKLGENWKEEASIRFLQSDSVYSHWLDFRYRNYIDAVLPYSNPEIQILLMQRAEDADRATVTKVHQHLMKNPINFELIRNYLAWNRVLLKNQMWDASYSFLSLLELQTKTEQQRFIVQQEFRFVDFLKPLYQRS